jgi:hypothetical protein
MKAKSQTVRAMRRDQFQMMAGREQQLGARVTELVALLTEAVVILEHQADGGVISVSDSTAYDLINRCRKAL